MSIRPNILVYVHRSLFISGVSIRPNILVYVHYSSTIKLNLYYCSVIVLCIRLCKLSEICVCSGSDNVVCFIMYPKINASSCCRQLSKKHLHKNRRLAVAKDLQFLTVFALKFVMS